MILGSETPMGHGKETRSGAMLKPEQRSLRNRNLGTHRDDPDQSSSANSHTARGLLACESGKKKGGGKKTSKQPSEKQKLIKLDLERMKARIAFRLSRQKQLETKLEYHQD